MSSRQLAARVARGAVSGTLATGVMSLFMLAARRANWLGTPPPKKLTDRFLRALGGSTHARSSWPMTAFNHAAFGAVAAVPFALLSDRLSTAGRVLAGSLYGASIWAVMYQGVLPAVDVMPRPRWDRPGRPTSMALAHLVYGAALGGLVDARSGRTAPTPPKTAG